MTKQSIIVVSGLPRSGTSMMMRMLAIGGLSLLTDGKRRADADNPGGYYELEQVKQLSDNMDWVVGAVGRVVKIVSPLLYDLPDGYNYRVLFMERDLDEVMASQLKMLERRSLQSAGREEGVEEMSATKVLVADKAQQDGKDGEPEEEVVMELRTSFRKHLREVRQWLAEQEHIEVLYLSYNDLLRDPSQGVSSIGRFLRKFLNERAMTAVIDPQLYRQRCTAR